MSRPSVRRGSEPTSEVPVPNYVLEWQDQLVEWVRGPLKGMRGTVYQVVRRRLDKEMVTLVSVVRGDGFLSPWVNTDDLAKVRKVSGGDDPRA